MERGREDIGKGEGERGIEAASITSGSSSGLFSLDFDFLEPSFLPPSTAGARVVTSESILGCLMLPTLVSRVTLTNRLGSSRTSDTSASLC